MRRILAILLSPIGFILGYGKCGKCNATWMILRVHDSAEVHTTLYNGGSGIFALCQSCWNDLTPAERLPYYRRIVDAWEIAKEKWPLIEGAVLAGK